MLCDLEADEPGNVVDIPCQLFGQSVYSEKDTVGSVLYSVTVLRDVLFVLVTFAGVVFAYVFNIAIVIC